MTRVDAFLARFPSLYSGLRAVAARTLAALPAHQSLAPTELVHEAYLKMLDGHAAADWTSDRHFVSSAALAMRHITIDRIRARLSLKRGGGRDALSLDECLAVVEDGPERLALIVDDALEGFAREHPRSAEIVQLRFFLGFTEMDCARALGLSERTIRRDWMLAKVWLERALFSS